MINDEYEELPMNSSCDVCIELNVDFPNSEAGFKISPISALNSDYVKLQNLLNDSAANIIFSLKKEWLISHPILYLQPNGKTGFKLNLRKKKIHKKILANLK